MFVPQEKGSSTADPTVGSHERRVIETSADAVIKVIVCLLADLTKSDTYHTHRKKNTNPLH